MQHPEFTEEKHQIFYNKILSIGLDTHNLDEPVYKYTSINSVVKILKNHSVLFRAPHTFNDPFEFNLDLLDTSISRKEVKERLLNSKMIQQQISKTSLKKLINQRTNEELTAMYKNALISQREQAHVFCTSEKFDNILMWSHYADCHKGVCLGLKIPLIDSSLHCWTLRVRYDDKIKPMKFYLRNEEDVSVSLLYWAYTKSMCWKYESEVRSLIMNPGDGKVPLKDGFINVSFPPKWVEEIYFGVNSSKHDIDLINGILKSEGYVNVKITKKMKKKKNEFGIEP